MSVSLRTPHMFLEDSLRSQAFAIITPSVITRLPSKPVLGHCVNFEAPESSEDGQKVMVLLSVLWEPNIL